MNVTVFCGSHFSNRPVDRKAAEGLGIYLARRGHRLIYGGADGGLMGVLADAVLSHGGKVTGVIPQFLVDREIARRDLTKLIVVKSMSARKNRMLKLGDAFIALPGGPGTLEEISQAVSSCRLGLMDKPCILYNVLGYYDPLEELFDEMAASGFLREEERSMVSFAEDLDDIRKILEDPRD